MSKLFMGLLLITFQLSVVAQNSKPGFTLNKSSVLSDELDENATNQIRRLRLQESISGLEILKTENLSNLLNKVEVDLSFLLPNTKAVLTDIDYRSSTDYTWKGKFGDNLVFFTVYKGELHGQIRHKGQAYDIQPLGTEHAVLIKYNMPYLKTKTCEADETYGHHEDLNLLKSVKEAQARAAGSTNIIDVLVLYSQAAENTGLNPNTIAINAVQQWQTAKSNSNVFTEFNLVGVEKFSEFIEGDKAQDDAIALSNNVNAQSRRNTKEADIVLMLTNGTSPDYNTLAGVVANIGPIDGTSYGLVQIANATSTISFAHEAAHLIGARHQITADTTSGDQHGHGWKTGFLIFTNRYTSVMHTMLSNADRTFHFSNPNVENNNRDTGITGVSNNARVLTNNGNIVCAYRGDVNPLSASISGVVTAQNGELKTFSASINGGTGPYNYTWVARGSKGAFLPGGSNNTYAVNIPTGENLLLDLTVTDSEGRLAFNSKFVRNLDAGGGGTGGPEDPSIFQDAMEELAVEEINEVIIFPNPTVDYLQIAVPEAYYQAQLLDISGKVIFTKELTLLKDTGIKGHLLQWDLTAQKQGIYLVKLFSDNETTTYRVIKE